MKKQKLVKICEAENGFRVVWPSLFGLLADYSDVFYFRGFPGTKVPENRFVVVEGKAKYALKEKRLRPIVYRAYSYKICFENYDLLDVRGNEIEAMKVCKAKAYEIAEEKAGSKYNIKSLEQIIDFV